MSELDLPDGDSNDSWLRGEVRKYLIRIAVFSVINILLFTFVQLDARTYQQRLFVGLKAIFIFLPILGFILGSLVSLVSYRDLPYRKKYLRASLLTIYIAHALMFLMAVYSGILVLIGQSRT